MGDVFLPSYPFRVCQNRPQGVFSYSSGRPSTNRQHVHSILTNGPPRPPIFLKKAALNTIIGANVAVFGAYHMGSSQTRQWLMDNFTISLRNWRAGRWWTIITSAFAHRDLPHIVGNMFSLYAFWGVLANAPTVGPIKLLVLATGSAISGSAAWMYHAGMDHPYASALGASGMVMGIAGAAAMINPFALFQIFPIPIAIPLWVLIPGYWFYDSYYLNSSGQIGHAAHLGGLAFGLLYGALAFRGTFFRRRFLGRH